LNLFQAVSLGIIQGLTEFLPVSSSGHLVLLQNFFGLKEPELLFDISLHVGTLLAVCVIFRQSIFSILKSLIELPVLVRSSGGWKRLYHENRDIRLAGLIVIGSIPTAVLGLLFKNIVEHIFGALWIVGIMLLVTGMLLWLTRLKKTEGRPVLEMRITDALLIGLIQGMAIMPGISRSGATISLALFLGIDRELAGRFSFLLSIPAILGALLLSMGSPDMQTAIAPGIIIIGAVVSGIVGYAALILLLKIVKKGKLYHFSPYCLLVGLGALIWSLA